MIKVNEVKQYDIPAKFARIGEKNGIDIEGYSTLIIEGKLVLLKDDRPTCEGLIRCIKPWKSFIHPEIDFANVGDITIGKNWSKGVFEYWEPIKPICVSEIDGIEDGDFKYAPKNGQIIRHNMDMSTKNQFKILALPEHFSPEQLQMIVDGKLKDGDKRLIECQKRGYCEGCNRVGMRHCAHADTCGYPIEYTEIKLNSSNHITIYPVEEKMYSESQVLDMLNKFGQYVDPYHIHSHIRWFEQNIK